MHVGARQRMECEIALTVVRDALLAGYWISVDDGEDEPSPKTCVGQDVAMKLMTTDEDTILIYKGSKAKAPLGVVTFIYGNSGYDVIHDYTDRPAIRKIVKRAEKIAEKYGDEDHESDSSKILREIFPLVFDGSELA
jgi:hypothetical protein